LAGCLILWINFFIHEIKNLYKIGMEEMDVKKISGAVEALLFIYGEPLEFKKIADILGVEKVQIESALDDLKTALSDDSRGLTLVFHGNKVQLATKPGFAGSVEKIIKEEYEENLTPAALETLSLVGYLGPISRNQIDYYRGVNSSYTLRNLMMRGLVEKYVDSKNQHMFLYQVSIDLLKHLGISKIEELPDYQKFKEILENKEPEVQINAEPTQLNSESI
jgi:segregation and condensation protein B